MSPLSLPWTFSTDDPAGLDLENRLQDVFDTLAGQLPPRPDFTPPADAPTGAIGVTMARANGLILTSALTIGQMRLAGVIRVAAGRTVTSVSVFSGSTAANLPTHQWFALVDALTLAKLAVTNDDTTTAWAAGTEKKLNLSTPWTPAADTLVTIGAVVTGTGAPTLVTGTSGAYPHLLVAPIVGGNSSSALTDPTSCPATVATPASGASPFLAWLS